MKIKSISAVLLFAIGILLFYCCSAGAVSVNSAPSLFEPGSLKKIEKLHTGQPFLLVVWSVDCPPCREELGLLSKIIKQHPEFHLVLVSTDSPEASGQLTAMLESYKLAKVESWIFSNAAAERLRYEIDPTWYGEIPRSYFYDPSHKRNSLSGALKSGQIKAWLEKLKTTSNRKTNR